MLNKLSRYTIIALIILVSALYLPDFYSMLFDKKVNTPMLDYSAVIDEFVVLQNSGMGQIEYRDIKGNTYGEREYFQLLPFNYYANLEKWQQMPAEVKGFEMSSKSIRQNSQFFRIEPKNIDPPGVPAIYILFEAEPDYAQLMIPDDVFRFGNKIEFIDPVSNKVIEEKSALFQQAMEQAGFTFPATLVAGNPTNRKPFDEGYFVKDARGEIFQMKMIHGKPVVTKTGIDPDLKVRQIFVEENLRKEFYGSLLTEDNGVYLIMYDNYRLQKLPTACADERFNYIADDMIFRCYTLPVYRHIQVRGDGFIKMYVVSNDFEPVAEHVETWTPYMERASSIVKGFLFPFELTTATSTKHVNMQMDVYGWKSLAGIAASLLALALFSRKRPWFDYLIVLLTGVFGLIGVLLIK
ncbi:MAG: DUF4857 domain-containing protein, partial [Candidatus Marinimicrobia bacterium]|nr:DUF4857 domain-containing protein [Candidatus Neomarinimicrobiota bacterium]